MIAKNQWVTGKEHINEVLISTQEGIFLFQPYHHERDR